MNEGVSSSSSSSSSPTHNVENLNSSDDLNDAVNDKDYRFQERIEGTVQWESGTCL